MAQHSFLQNLLQGQAVEWKTLGGSGCYRHRKLKSPR